MMCMMYFSWPPAFGTGCHLDNGHDGPCEMNVPQCVADYYHEYGRLDLMDNHWSEQLLAFRREFYANKEWQSQKWTTPILVGA